MWDRYLFASSVGDALHKLAELEGEGRIIAGGTDLVLQAQRGQCAARTVVDITRIPEIDRISEHQGHIVIGAATTHAQIVASELIRARAPVLAQACAVLGGPQIRNVGTLGGNIVNALPAADGAVALFALDAEVEVATLDGTQWLPIAELYEDVGVCAVDPRVQMVTAIRFSPMADDMGSDLQRLARRKALALPILNTAAVACVRNGCWADVRIAVGPVAPTPFRAVRAERSLLSQPVAEPLIRRAAWLAAADAHPRASILRGSQEYRTAMVEVLVRRALTNATALAAGS